MAEAPAAAGRGKAFARSSAVKFIVLLGLVSLLADITYEGARSITGPFLATLGASAAAVGFIAGFGELIGYSLRLVSGILTDRTQRYWAITIIGYAVNLLAVPLLALAGRWEVAAGLIVAERLGKAIRTPARDAMLSRATGLVGAGWGFGLHEAMDQVGALAGPLVVSLALWLNGGYRTGFIWLAVPALLAMAVVLAARFIYPNPARFDAHEPIQGGGIPRPFWIYLAGVSLIAAGYSDFPLIAYHFQRHALAGEAAIPLLYSVAMGADAIAALVFGRLYDRKGAGVMVAAALLSALFAPLVFLWDLYPAVAGMVLWGIGMGAQESIMRAAVAGMVSPDRRGFAYGAFNTCYGLFWFAGSALMGILYDASVAYLVAFSIAAQLAAVPFLLLARAGRDAKATSG